MKRFTIFTLLLLVFGITLSSFQGSSNFIVVIDAAHGGKDPGSISNNLTEAEFTLALSKVIAKKHSNPDIQLIFTRSSDEFLDLNDRIEIAKKHNANLFISLHCNESPNKNANGIELYFPSEGAFQDESRKFCQSLKSQFEDNQVVMSINKMEAGKFFVINNSNCASSLIELGFISNKKDRKAMKDSNELDKMAMSIIKCIETQYALSLRN